MATLKKNILGYREPICVGCHMFRRKTARQEAWLLRMMKIKILNTCRKQTVQYSNTVQMLRDSILSLHTLKWMSNNIPNYLDNDSSYRQTDCYIVLAVTMSSWYFIQLFISSKITILTFATFAPIISTTTWRVCLKFNLDRVLMYI